MHTIALLSIAVVASLVTAAIAQTASDARTGMARQRARAGAGGLCRGRAYRTDEAALTGYLAVYPANANDPKSPASVFAPRQVLVVKLGKSDGGCVRCRPN